jgi:hypothetical protein
MAEVLVGSQSPVTHKVFWNGDVADATSAPVVKIYDVTNDPAVSPAIASTTLLTTITSTLDENNPGTYTINVPYAYTDRNRTLRLKWEYAVSGTSVVKTEDVFVVTPYVDFNHIQDMGFASDSSDPGYKSYSDLIKAEKYARKQIEGYTGQYFYLYDDVYVVYGYESDTLPLPAKINSLQKLFVKDILLIDNLSSPAVNNWGLAVNISETKFGLRVDRSSTLDNAVYIANGMVPPSIHDYSGIFQSGIPYKVQARFGWNSVPENVEQAAAELMKDYFSKDTMWRNKYVKNISTFDWDFEYTGNAYTGTGNAYADNLLADYVLTAKAEII